MKAPISRLRRWQLLSLLPGTAPYRAYHDTIEFADEVAVQMRHFWGSGFPAFPAELRKRNPTALLILVKCCLRMLYTTQAAEDGLTREQVLAVFEEHRVGLVVQETTFDSDTSALAVLREAAEAEFPGTTG